MFSLIEVRLEWESEHMFEEVFDSLKGCTAYASRISPSLGTSSKSELLFFKASQQLLEWGLVWGG